MPIAFVPDDTVSLASSPLAGASVAQIALRFRPPLDLFDTEANGPLLTILDSPQVRIRLHTSDFRHVRVEWRFDDSTTSNESACVYLLPDHPNHLVVRFDGTNVRTFHDFHSQAYDRNPGTSDTIIDYTGKTLSTDAGGLTLGNVNGPTGLAVEIEDLQIWTSDLPTVGQTLNLRNGTDPATLDADHHYTLEGTGGNPVANGQAGLADQIGSDDLTVADGSPEYTAGSLDWEPFGRPVDPGSTVDPVINLHHGELVAPVSVAFDIHGTVGVHPWNIQDAEVLWEIDDPAGDERCLPDEPIASWNRQPWNRPTGFAARYLFEQAGTYNISVTVRRRDGTMGTASTQVTIADEPTGGWETRFLRSDGDDNADGDSHEDAWESVGPAINWLKGGPNRRLRVHCGDTWTDVGGTNSLVLDQTDLTLIDSYVSPGGSTEKPKWMRVQGQSKNDFFQISGENIRITGLHLIDSTSHPGRVFFLTNDPRHILLHDLVVDDSANVVHTTNAGVRDLHLDRCVMNRCTAMTAWLGFGDADNINPHWGPHQAAITRTVSHDWLGRHQIRVHSARDLVLRGLYWASTQPGADGTSGLTMRENTNGVIVTDSHIRHNGILGTASNAASYGRPRKILAERVRFRSAVAFSPAERATVRNCISTNVTFDGEHRRSLFPVHMDVYHHTISSTSWGFQLNPDNVDATEANAIRFHNSVTHYRPEASGSNRMRYPNQDVQVNPTVPFHHNHSFHENGSTSNAFTAEDLGHTGNNVNPLFIVVNMNNPNHLVVQEGSPLVGTGQELHVSLDGQGNLRSEAPGTVGAFVPGTASDPGEPEPPILPGGRSGRRIGRTGLGVSRSRGWRGRSG